MNSRSVGRRAETQDTYRKVWSRPFVCWRYPHFGRAGFGCVPGRAPSRFDVRFRTVSKSDRYGPVTRDPLGVALHNHTPIERPAQGLSFDARVDSISVQVLSVDPLARPAGLTCWISLCLAGFVLSSRNSRSVGSGPTQPYTHRKACSRPFI